MPPHFQLVDSVLKRLDDVYKPTVGCLYGILYEGKVLIVGMGFELNVPQGPVWYDSAQQIYPTGIDWCGVFSLEEDISQTVDHKIVKKIKNIAVTNNPIYLRKDLIDGNMESYYFDGINLRLCQYQKLKEDEFRSKFVFLHLLGKIQICLPINTTRNCVVRETEQLSARIAAGMFFRLAESDIYLNKFSKPDENVNLGMIFDSLKTEKEFRVNMEVLKVYALFPKGPIVNEVNKLPAAQLYDYTCRQAQKEGGSINKIIMFLPFDALCIAHRDRNLDDIYNILIDTLERTVFLCESYLMKYIDDPIKVHNLRAHHFFPAELAHPLSLVFSTEQNDEKLASIRRKIHDCLNLPLDKPYFRKSNSLKFLPLDFKPYPLMNVHIGLKPSGIRSDRSKCSITKGAYHYYHYMMDGFNDKGWGCAYRSFQTIFSWFKLQGYSSTDVPSHKQIQECLVSVGDKPSNFIGSKTWIGSTEVSYVLEMSVGATSLILNIPSGSEINTIGTALYEHFEQQGVPIMIGGGVLAHTILGIDIDEGSGEMKFLVLDPHYTEEDDVQKIQRKGFVGWKGIDFWDSKSFYNLCLPQRPRCY